MSKYDVTTAELINEYFSTMPETSRKRRQAQVDRQELYDYEVQSSVCFLDMQPENIAEMVNTFGTGANENWRKSHISKETKRNIVTTMRSIYDYYNEHYSPKIANPLRSKRATEIMEEKVYSHKEKFTEDTLKTMKSFISLQYDEEMANYTQCILELFVAGFADAREISLMKERDINFETREIYVDGRTVRLSEEAMKLLNTVHRYNGMGIDFGRSVMADWRGSYFVFPVRKKLLDSFDEREIAPVANLIYDRLTKYVVNKIDSIDPEIGYRTLYLYGFYKHLKEMFGDDDVKNMIYSVNERQYTERYCDAAEEYGISVNRNIAILKRMLTQFE